MVCSLKEYMILVCYKQFPHLKTHSPRRATSISPDHLLKMVELTKEQIKQLEIIKKKLSKMSIKEKIKLLNDKGVKKLMQEATKEMEE